MLRLEQLERRDVPSTLSVTYHGGPVLRHAEVENVYWGQDWNTAAGQTNAGQLDTFMSVLTRSSYLGMLGYYGVGLGRFGQRDVVAGAGSPTGTADATRLVTETDIQNMLSAEIQANNLPESNGTQVYFVYLPPNVRSNFDVASNSFGHHNMFQMDYLHQGRHFDYTTRDTVYYAVIPNPVGNRQVAALTPFQQQTEVSSHELAETVTDPEVWQAGGGWHGTGWHSGTSGDWLGEEIGDLADVDYGTMAGYVVQKEWLEWMGRGYLPSGDSAGVLGTSASWGQAYSYYQSFGGHLALIAKDSAGNSYIQWDLGNGEYSGWSPVELGLLTKYGDAGGGGDTYYQPAHPDKELQASAPEDTWK